MLPMENLVTELTSTALAARLIGVAFCLAALVFLFSGAGMFFSPKDRPAHIVAFATFMILGALCLLAGIFVLTTPTEILEAPTGQGAATSPPAVSDQPEPTTESTP